MFYIVMLASFFFNVGRPNSENGVDDQTIHVIKSRKFKSRTSRRFIRLISENEGRVAVDWCDRFPKITHDWQQLTNMLALVSWWWSRLRPSVDSSANTTSYCPTIKTLKSRGEAARKLMPFSGSSVSHVNASTLPRKSFQTTEAPHPDGRQVFIPPEHVSSNKPCFPAFYHIHMSICWKFGSFDIEQTKLWRLCELGKYKYFKARISIHGKIYRTTGTLASQISPTGRKITRKILSKQRTNRVSSLVGRVMWLVTKTSLTTGRLLRLNSWR